ncbi:MAG TPA: hypothetical protein VFG25_02525 [Nitrosopumilaceae archaeon]|nr:hypothetical protein [Nitrosopumilaceae archaeon]
MAIQRISKISESSRQSNPQFNPILKAMGEEFGYVAAHAILSHVSHSTLKSMAEILTSDYEKFSTILKQVYTEEIAQKEILDRLDGYKLREQMG